MLNAMIGDAKADLCAQETLFLRYSNVLVDVFSMINYTQQFLSCIFKLDQKLSMLKGDIDEKNTILIPVSSVAVISVLDELEQEVTRWKEVIQSTEEGPNMLLVWDKWFVDMNSAILAIKQIISEKILPQPTPV